MVNRTAQPFCTQHGSPYEVMPMYSNMFCLVLSAFSSFAFSSFADEERAGRFSLRFFISLSYGCWCPV